MHAMRPNNTGLAKNCTFAVLMRRLKLKWNGKLFPEFTRIEHRL